MRLVACPPRMGSAKRTTASRTAAKSLGSRSGRRLDRIPHVHVDMERDASNREPSVQRRTDTAVVGPSVHPGGVARRLARGGIEQKIPDRLTATVGRPEPLGWYLERYETGLLVGLPPVEHGLTGRLTLRPNSDRGGHCRHHPKLLSIVSTSADSPRRPERRLQVRTRSSSSRRPTCPRPDRDPNRAVAAFCRAGQCARRPARSPVLPKRPATPRRHRCLETIEP
jgi:hypothetical protein